jgi:hypothetical protein
MGAYRPNGAVTQPAVDRYAELRAMSIKVVDAYAASVADYLKKKSQKSAVDQAKKVVANSLKDPSSAQFRNVQLVPYKDSHVICGEVNGKNSYGGYVGFRPFVASVTASEIARTGGRFAEIDRAANAGLVAACG